MTSLGFKKLIEQKNLNRFEFGTMPVILINPEWHLDRKKNLSLKRQNAQSSKSKDRKTDKQTEGRTTKTKAEW